MIFDANLAHQDEVGETYAIYPGISVPTWLKFFGAGFVSKLLLVLYAPNFLYDASGPIHRLERLVCLICVMH